VTWVVAHRGAWAEAPENSLEAFERAIELGADMLEFDVRRTRAGELVVHHDPIAERGAAPLLTEVLALARGRVAIDVELKEDGYVEDVAQALRSGFDLEAVVVTSFLDAVVGQIGRRLPAVRTGLLLGVGRPPNLVRTRASELYPITRARRCGADYLAPELRLARLGVLRRAHAAGYPALVWTVNRDADIAALLRDDRVAGVITDVPGRALELRDGV
jgi:glycerophosphoryl diester phosphodiesterase